MLQSIRDRLVGPIVWFVVGLIAIPFAFWGIDSFSTGGGDPLVAKVGDQRITQGELKQAYDQRYQQYRELVGDNFRPELFDQDHFRELTLDALIQESALRQFARDSGYRASDATLRDYLTSIPAFQKDGKFSTETYQSLLAARKLPVDRYESQLRESLVIDQVRSAVQETAVLTQADAWQARRLEKQVRKLSTVVVAAKSFEGRAEVTDTQLAERYEQDKARFQSPERIRVAYVQLDRTKLKPAEAPAAEILKVIYDTEKEQRFSSVEERHASHVLVGFGSDKSAARSTAEGILARLKAGADFGAEAKAHSEDPGSKDKGGDLGWVRKGMMVPAFEAALFAMNAGELVGPVETDFGWHLIRLDEIKAPSVRAFDEPAVQSELLDVYRKREDEKRFQELSTRLEQLAFENTSLEPVASDLGLEIQTSDWFTRAGGAGVLANEGLRTAAFSDEVLTDNENSKPVPVSADALVVLRKVDYEAARQQPLEEVRELVRAIVSHENMAKLAQETADGLVAGVRGGQSLATAAQSRNLTIGFDGEVVRTDTKLDPAVTRAAFRMARPPAGAVRVEAVPVRGGDVVVVALSEVQDPPKPEAELLADETARRMRDSLAGAEFLGYRKAIEQVVTVKRVETPQASSETDEP